MVARSEVALALVAAVTLAPGLALAQDAPAPAAEADRPTSLVTFYGHVFGATRFAPMPMNVEFPDGEEDFSAGYGDTCGVAPADVGEAVLVGVYADCEAEPNNELWLYSTAGFVDVVDGNDFDYEKVHNERGLTKDTYLDTTKSIVATLYMSADAHAYSSALCNLDGLKPHDVPEPIGCWNWDPGTQRGWTVRATLFAGVLGEYGGEANTAPDVASAFDSGALEVIAEGTSQPTDMVGLEVAGQPTVWKFDVDLGAPKVGVIPKEKSYLVRFEWWGDVGGSKVILPPNWNLDSGQYYPPSITIPVKNAFDVESVIPQFVHEKLVLLGILNTPWGSYDVDQESVKLTIQKGDSEVSPVRIQKLADYSVAHGGHYKPVNVTWVWDYRGDRLAPGTYTAIVSASNYQHSASSQCQAEFEIKPNGEPGQIKVGACAVATLTAEQLAKINEGLGASGSGERAAPPALPPLVPVAALAGITLFRRRWDA